MEKVSFLFFLQEMKKVATMSKNKIVDMKKKKEIERNNKKMSPEKEI